MDFNGRSTRYVAVARHGLAREGPIEEALCPWRHRLSVTSHRSILLVQCPDQSGIIARFSTAIFEMGGNILRSDQYSTDPDRGRFFMRVEMAHAQPTEALSPRLCELAASLGGAAQLHDRQRKMRMALAVSRYDHCLLHLLYLVRKGELAAEVPCVVSNHDDLRRDVENLGIPFHHVPVDPNDKAAQERAILELLGDQSEFLVMARYMQVLSGDFLRAYGKDVINIHHSFLPSFVGGNPYQQAYERGVKIIGATAHYATADLDEGPIIEQMVERVSIRDDVASLKSKGRHLEQLALARAVQAHLEHRVIRLERRTVVFD